MNFNLQWFPVWKRNFLVWRKLLLPSLVGNFIDPLIYLLALGFGLGYFVGQIDGMPYLVFLASGIVCTSAMHAATFESLYSVYTRISWQKTWDSMIATPLDVNNIVQGEALWAATKGLINAAAILLVAACFGLIKHWMAIFTLPVVLLLSACFASIGLIVTSFAKSYDYFTYYMTLIISPMMFLSDVFFPIDRMPVAIQTIAKILPLYNAVVIVRPLIVGRPIHDLFLHVGVLVAYTVVAYLIAVPLLRKRVIN